MIYLLIGLHITFFVVAGFLTGLLYAMAILIKAQKNDYILEQSNDNHFKYYCNFSVFYDDYCK